MLAPLADIDVSNEAFGYFKARTFHVGHVPVTALRLSYVGELGWELYTTADMGRKLWDELWAAGRPHGLIAAGRSAFGSLRLEKGYRSWGTDMTTEHDPFEAGLGFAVRLDKGEFTGRAAIAGRSEATAGRRLVPLVLDDPTEVLMGKEPVVIDGRTAGYVTSAAFGYTIERVASPTPGCRPAAATPGTARLGRLVRDAARRDRRGRPAIRPGDAEAEGMTATTAADPRTATILDAIGETPLVRIDDIWVKLEFLNPSGSVKARIARYMIERAEREGRLRPGDTIVEASSGNTGNAMSMVAAVKGYRMLVVMPEGMSPERLAISRAFGAEVLTLGDFHVTQALEKARELGSRPGYFSPQQFDSEWNVDENREWLGPELLRQLPDGVVPDAIVAAWAPAGR